MRNTHEAAAATSRRGLLRTFVAAGAALVGWSRTGVAQSRTTTSALQRQAQGVGQRLRQTSTPDYSEFDRFLRALEASPHANAIAAVYLAILASVRQQQEDHRYWIEKVRELNEQGEALAEALKEYNDELTNVTSKDEAECNASQARATAASLDRRLRNVETKIGQLDRRAQLRVTSKELLAVVQRDRTIIAKLQNTYRKARCD